MSASVRAENACCKGLITLNMGMDSPGAGDTYCDLISVGWPRTASAGKAGVESAQSDDLSTDCGEGIVSHGTGAIAKVKGAGNTMVNGDDQLTAESGGYSYYGLAFEYSFPLVTGGTYSVYASTTCCSSFLVLTGTYNFTLTGASHRPRNMKRISVIRDAIAKGLIKLPAKRGM